MKSIKNKIVLLVGLIILSTACNKLDINYNPVQPVTVPSTQRLPAIQANLAYSLYSQARFAAYHSYYVTTRIGNSNAITDTWNYNNINRMGAWRWHYFDVGANVKGMLIRAKEDNSNNFSGVGKILLAFSYLTATDMFGDMPFSEAYTDSFNPLYDKQEDVLKGIITLLDEGESELDHISELAQTMNGASDLIYKGDYAKWKAFSKAVRARVKLRTANFDNGYAELLTLINDALQDFDDALFVYPEKADLAWEKNMWGESKPQPEWQFADIRNDLSNSLPTDVLMKALTIDPVNGIYDQRLYALTSPGEKGKYLGAKMSEGLRDINLPTGTVYQDFANLNLGYWTSDNSPYPIMLKEELYFIKAEAQFYLNDSQGALVSYQEGIRFNMKRLGVLEAQMINYLGSSKVAQTPAALKISDIMMQKYIALYLQGETWTDMRRYGYSTKAYPDLYYPKYALAEWSGKNIQRFPYDPQTEYVFNPKEIARLGAATRSWAFTPVWWAEQSTLKD